MTKRTKIISVLFAVTLISFLALKFQTARVPYDESLVSQDDGDRNDALRRFVDLPEEKRIAAADALISTRVGSADPRERRLALYALRKSGLSTPPVLAAMVGALDDADASVREEARACVSERGDVATPLVIASLGDPAADRDETVRLLATNVSEKDVPLLISALTSGNDRQAQGAAMVFARVKDPDVVAASKPALSALSALVISTEPTTAAEAAFALHAMDPLDKRVIPVFLRLIQEEDWEAPGARGRAALEGLGDIPLSAPQTVPVLQRLARTKPDYRRDNIVSPRAAIAAQLDRLDPRDRSLNGLRWDLKNKDSLIRFRALMFLSAQENISPVLRGPLAVQVHDADAANAARAAICLKRLDDAGELGLK